MRDTTVRSGQVFPSWCQPRRAKTSSTLECVKNGEIVSRSADLFSVVPVRLGEDRVCSLIVRVLSKALQQVSRNPSRETLRSELPAARALEYLPS